MAATAKKTIEYALSQVGTKEHDNNKNKYSEELDKISYYNTKKNPAHADWCAIFQDDSAYNAAGKDKAKALYISCEPEKDNCGASCYYQYVYFKKYKRFFTEPKLGDRVIFGTKLAKGCIKHIGLVVKIDGKKITTVEGNKGNKVSKCTYTLGGKNNILGFLRPRYDKEPEPAPAPTPTPTPKPGGGIAPATQYNSSDAGTYEVTADELNVRQDAGITCEKITELKKGDKVKCYGYSKKDRSGCKWFAIMTSGGVEGYSSAKWLKPIR